MVHLIANVRLQRRILGILCAELFISFKLYWEHKLFFCTVPQFFVQCKRNEDNPEALGFIYNVSM